MERFPAEQASGQGAPGNNAQPEFLRRWQHLEFRQPTQQIVFVLLTDQPQEMPFLGHCLRIHEMAGPEIARTNIVDLALVDERFKSTPYFCQFSKKVT